MENMEKELRSKMALLESQLDLMESEKSYLDKVLKDLGFPEGMDSLKATMEDLIAHMPPEEKGSL
jgi:hypothetical protein